MDENFHIPRKAHITAHSASPSEEKGSQRCEISRPTSTEQKKPRSHRITVKSEKPFVIKIVSCSGKPLTARRKGSPTLSGPQSAEDRSPPVPRKRKIREVDFSYADGFSDDEGNSLSRNNPVAEDGSESSKESMHTVATPYLPRAKGGALVSLPSLDPNAVDSPPAGQLASLWYSQESFLEVFVIDKILGWKTRPKPIDLPPGINVTMETALKVQERLLSLNATDQRRRMEVSRINALRCPSVLAGFCEEQPHQNHPREEVLLIKWRGRSYRHCSWERATDLIKFDPSNNTAKGKIKRFVASQETTLGHCWKQVLEDGRRGSARQPRNEDSDDVEEDEELFPPDYLEVERVLACDEGEMDMNVLTKQRALNLRSQKEAGDEASEKVDDHMSVKSGNSKHKKGECEDDSWDPEDNVRYVIKWKGLQASDLTWEYWRDIKHDFVDVVEDFWWRQRTPTDLEIMGKPHPNVRDFKKLAESPSFGVSKRHRAVYDFGDGFDCGAEENNGEEETLSNALRLRSYQLEGVNWLLWNWWNQRSCILADEMGLGKTIQTMCFLNLLSLLNETKVRGPFLIVAPLSLVNQWQSEAAAWAPDMNVLLYHGSADARAFMVEYEFYFIEPFVNKTTALKLKRQHVTKFHLLITTYEVAMKDIALLSKIRWKAVIVDEAHRLKNAKSRLFMELSAVPRDFCLLLTGTPLQNSTEELWALLNFSDSSNFFSKDAFVQKFGQLTDASQVSDLHAVLKPYLLRRVKEDVAKALPPKEETILEVALTPIQKNYYKAIYERNTTFLFKGGRPSNAPSLMNVMMELRKCCNHPFLIRGAEERILADAATTAPVDPVTDKVDMIKLVGEKLVKSSGKMVLLDKLLPKLFAGGHKVLIFSQMVRALDLLAELLRLKNYKFERLDGSTSASARAGAVDRFHRKSCQRFVMLLSTRAGGLGLNLTAADTVIIFDSDWNPQNDLQAMARAHRIGQTRAVRVYRLLTSKTYEMHMFHSASMKLGLDRAVLAHQRQNEVDDAVDGDNTKVKSKSKSKSERENQAREIDELLKKGAYDVFREDDDNEAQQFMETDIDQLLERSSRTVTYGSDATNSFSSGLGSFSKASFVATTGDGEEKDVDLDDPDFWEKSVGLEAPPESAMQTDVETALLLEKYSDKKRSRKQVQVYDPYASFAEAEKKKKDKLAQKAKEEKEEKERLRLEKKRQKIEEKKRKRRERDEMKAVKVKMGLPKEVQRKQLQDWDIMSSKGRLSNKEGKSKKLKIAERKKVARLLEMEDPMFERMKNAWENTDRDAVTHAALRFGFARFCKIRQEANMTILPIQDIEVFLRAYVFQLGLQAAVSLLTYCKLQLGRCSAPDGHTVEELAPFVWSPYDVNSISVMLSALAESDIGTWISRAIFSVLSLYEEIRNGKRYLRLPLTLTDPSFVSKLVCGGALKGLRRFALMSRLNCVVEKALENVLQELGPEELGKRGCQTKNLSELDVDSKAKLVTTEELSYAIGDHLVAHRASSCSWSYPAPWWDRACDVGLVIGTFIHGLGNYNAMLRDGQLPFGWKLGLYARGDPHSVAAMHLLNVGTKSVNCVFAESAIAGNEKEKPADKKVFSSSKQCDDKVFSGRQDKSQTLASKNKSERRIDPNPTISSSSLASSHSSSETVTKGKETARVSLWQVAHTILKSIRCQPRQRSSNNTTKTTDESDTNGCILLEGVNKLPMPDSRVLDMLLVRILETVEGNKCLDSKLVLNETRMGQGKTPEDNAIDIITEALKRPNALWEGLSIEFSSLDLFNSYSDRSGFIYEAASDDLAALATGSNLNRRKRGSCVPRLFTRYCIISLMLSDQSLIEHSLLLHKNQPTRALENGASVKPGEPLKDPDETAEPVLSIGPSQGGMDSLTLWKDDAQSRAKMCIVLLNMGTPSSNCDTYTSINSEVLKLLVGSDERDSTVSPETFRNRVRFFTIEDMIDAASISKHSVEAISYLNEILIPHCLLVCVQFADDLNRARNASNSCKSMASNFTAVSASSGSDIYNWLPSTPLPDPYVSLARHSDTAVMLCLAILRRARLMSAVRFIVGGGVSDLKLLLFLKGPEMRQNMDGVPIWWCPWIHDLGLLLSTAKDGLFAVLRRRRLSNVSEKNSLGSTCFSKDAIERHIRSLFVDGKNGDRKPVLPRCFLNSASVRELDEWVTAQTAQFPTAHVIERRIAMICSNLTHSTVLKEFGVPEEEIDRIVYSNTPMLDHGSWPSLGSIKFGTGLSYSSQTGSLLNTSLLTVAEEEL